MIRIPSFGNKKQKEELTPDRRYFRITLWAFLALFIILSLSALTGFLLTLRGPSQTQVPDMVADELVDALIKLQERDLFPRIQVRYHSDPTLKGHVIAQEPKAGGIVRGGRRVVLIVSQGAVIEEIADYRGRLLQEVQSELQALGVGGAELIRIEGISYVFNDAPAGTVVEQSPAPGTEITGSTPVSLIVSRGPDVERISLPTFQGLYWADALKILARDNVPFIFRVEELPTIGQEGVIVAQEPEAGSQVFPDTPVQLTIRGVRDIDPGQRFGIFDRTLPEYAVSVELSAIAVGPEGESAPLFNMVHPGGRVAFPYILDVGTTIVLYRYDSEVIRYIVRDSSD
ncbi:MAG: PASTA domain-containing protein [Alkalispirochaeta sp.]